MDLISLPREKVEFTALTRFVHDDPVGPYFETTFRELGRSVVGVGATRSESVSRAEEEVIPVLEDILAIGQDFPDIEAVYEWDGFSGKFTVRCSKQLHYDLYNRAQREGVSLNSFIVESLTRCLGALGEFNSIAKQNVAGVALNLNLTQVNIQTDFHLSPQAMVAVR